jgi:AbrB family looped-hinge helix DNA binding protein
MLVRVTSKRQVTFPARVLDALGVRPGDRIELQEGPDGFILRPRRIDYDRLGTLRSRLRDGRGAFDVGAFRDEPYDPALRD